MAMAKVIRFYVPQTFFLTRRTAAAEPIGKLIEFPGTASKKSA
jgi:hypothetical protein